MNTDLTLKDCAILITALEEIEDKYKAVQALDTNIPAVNTFFRMMGAPDNFLDDIRQGLLEEGQAYMKAITTAKAKITLISAALEEAEEKAGKARLIAEAEEAISGA